MEQILIVTLLGFMLAAYVLVKVTTGIGRKVKGIFTGGTRRAGRPWVIRWMLRITAVLVGAILWASSAALRPALVALVLFLAWRAWRRLQGFLKGAESLWDAFLFRELHAGMDNTWATFPETTYVDPRGIEHLPETRGWRWVYDLNGQRFGITAEIVSAQGSSLGKIDDLTAQPGDKDERLAATLNRHLEKSKTLFASFFGPRMLEQLHFAAVDVQTTLERLQAMPNDATAIRSGHGVITLLMTDPLWDPVPIPMPMYAEPWTQVGLPIPLNLGVDRWGQEVSAKLGRILIMAKSGWGKSVLLDTILMQLVTLPADRVIVIVIDCKWGLHHAKWEPAIDWLVVHPDQATDCLRSVHDIMEARAVVMKANDQEKLPEATPRTPAIIVLTDEAQDLPKSGDMSKPAAMEYLTKINQKGRALGVHTITALQYGTAKEVPRGLTINVDLAIAGKLKDQSAARVAMGEIADKNFGPHVIPEMERNKGVFAMGNQETGFGTYVRIYNTEPADKLLMVNWAVEHNPRCQWDWIDYGEAAETIEVTAEEGAALDHLCAKLSIKGMIDLRDLPDWLDKAQSRMTPSDFRKTSKQLQRLLAA